MTVTYALLQALATETREINASKGWGESFDPEGNPDSLGSLLGLIHTEVTEALEEPKFDEALCEIGDVIVRSLDIIELIHPGWLAERGGKGFGLPSGFTPPPRDPRYPTWERDVVALHASISRAQEAFRKFQEWRYAVLCHLLISVIAPAWSIIANCGVNPESVVRRCLEKNRTRTYRHGGRRI